MWDSKKTEANINWFKKPEEAIEWLEEIFNSKNYKERMKALKKINEESINVEVYKNQTLYACD